MTDQSHNNNVSLETMQTQIISNHDPITMLEANSTNLEDLKKKEMLLLKSLKASLMTVDELKLKITALEKRESHKSLQIQQLKSANESLTATVTKLTAETKEKEQVIEEMKVTINTLEEKVDELEDDIMARDLDNDLDTEDIAPPQENTEPLKKKIDEQQHLIEELKSSISRHADLESKVKSSTEIISKLKTSLKNADTEIESYKKSINGLKSEKAESTTKLTSLEDELQKHKSEMKKLESRSSFLTNENSSLSKRIMDQEKIIEGLSTENKSIKSHLADVYEKNRKYEVINKQLFEELTKARNDSGADLMQKLYDLKDPLSNLLHAINIKTNSTRMDVDTSPKTVTQSIHVNNTVLPSPSDNIPTAAPPAMIPPQMELNNVPTTQQSSNSTNIPNASAVATSLINKQPTPSTIPTPAPSPTKPKQKRKTTLTSEPSTPKKPKTDSEFKSPIVLLVEEHLNNGTMVDVCALVRDHKTFFNELGETVDKSKSSPIPIYVAPVEFGVAGHKKNLPKCLESSEMAFAWLLICLRTEDPDLYKATLSEYVKQMRFCFNEKKLHVPYIRRFRLLVVVLKEEEHSHQQMIDALLDGLLGRNPSFHLIPCMYNLVCLWETFFENPDIEFGKTVQALRYCCLALSKDTPVTVKKSYEKLAFKLGWIRDSISVDDLVVNLKAELLGSNFGQLIDNDPVRFGKYKEDLFRGLFVAFAVMDRWNYLYDTFIRAECWPLLADNRRSRYIVELFGILGRLGVSNSPYHDDKPGLKTLLEILVKVAAGNSSNEEEKPLREEAKKSVLKIAAGSTGYSDLVQQLKE